MRLLVLIAMFCAATTSSVSAQSPVPIETVAPLSEIQLLIQEKIATLDQLLMDDSKFEEQKGKSIREAFGMLAVLGQSLAEIKGKEDAKINGPALRDAALQYTRKSTYAQARAALEQVHQVHAGQVSGEHAQLHPWNKLINMHPMMEEMSGGNSKILKVLKRPRGKADEPLPATTWALLAIAMKADTHEVKNPADVPQWNAWSDDFSQSAVKLAEAIRAKDKDEARKWFDRANETCDACHEKFRH